MTDNTHSRYSGFSLIEMIVVISVIVVLIALALPLISNVIERQHMVTCQAKLRQIGSGHASYIADHGGNLIPGAVVLSGWFWFDELNPYMGIHGMKRSANGRAVWEDGTAVPEYPQEWQICPSKPVEPLGRQTVGYGWNRHYFGHDFTAGNAWTGYGSKLSEVARPEATIIIGDSMDKPTAFNQSRYLYPNHASFPHARRHNGGGNYLYLDGRVSFHTPEFLVTSEGQNLFRKSAGKW